MDCAPYNSTGNQSFRTVLSAKVGSNRFLLPVNANLTALPINADTVMSAFCAVEGHPDRLHEHELYCIDFGVDRVDEGSLRSKLPLVNTDEKQIEKSSKDFQNNNPKHADLFLPELVRKPVG